MKKQFLFSTWAICLIFLLFSCGSDDNGSDPEMDEEMMEQTLSGNYTGTWNSVTPSVTFTDFPISATFTENPSNPDLITAAFFATSNFTSCCSTNSNDGTMIFNLDDNTITSFSFVDTIVDCEGNFSGDGIIDNSGRFIIDFTGSDCDGEHVGQLIFRR